VKAKREMSETIYAIGAPGCDGVLAQSYQRVIL
jgi:hypothetical protein